MATCPTPSVKLKTAGEAPPVKVTVSVRLMVLAQATELFVDIWNGVVFVCVPAGAMFG